MLQYDNRNFPSNIWYMDICRAYRETLLAARCNCRFHWLKWSVITVCQLLATPIFRWKKRSFHVSDCISLLSQTTAIVRAKILYERLVTQFPTSSRYWRLYIEQEVNLACHRFTLPYLHGYYPLGSLGVVACYTVVLQVEVEVDFTASSLQANLHAVLVMAMKVISLSSMSIRVVTILTINLTCKTCMWVIEVMVQPAVVTYSRMKHGWVDRCVLPRS